MTFKRQPMLVAIGYASFLTVLDIVACLFDAHAGQSGVSAFWSPVVVYILLNAMLPHPPRVSLKDQLRNLKTATLVVAFIIACVVTFRYFFSYSRAVADAGILVCFWLASKRVPPHDIQFDPVPPAWPRT